ncbi:PP3 [Orf virus]|uniref:PP3 n=1 Tax=Orf virus TaxID=10258 RepID=F1AXI9_ORFV|nr:PP3 [Orf virus]
MSMFCASALSPAQAGSGVSSGCSGSTPSSRATASLSARGSSASVSASAAEASASAPAASAWQRFSTTSSQFRRRPRTAPTRTAQAAEAGAARAASWRRKRARKTSYSEPGAAGVGSGECGVGGVRGGIYPAGEDVAAHQPREVLDGVRRGHAQPEAVAGPARARDRELREQRVEARVLRGDVRVRAQQRVREEVEVVVPVLRHADAARDLAVLDGGHAREVEIVQRRAHGLFEAKSRTGRSHAERARAVEDEHVVGLQVHVQEVRAARELVYLQVQQRDLQEHELEELRVRREAQRCRRLRRDRVRGPARQREHDHGPAVEHVPRALLVLKEVHQVVEVVDQVHVALHGRGVEVRDQAHEGLAVLARLEPAQQRLLGHLYRGPLAFLHAHEQQQRVQHAPVQRVQEAQPVVQPHGQRADHELALVALEVIAQEPRHRVLRRGVHLGHAVAVLEDVLDHVAVEAEHDAVPASGHVVHVVVGGREARVRHLEVGAVHVPAPRHAAERFLREVPEEAQQPHRRGPGLREVHLRGYVPQVDLVAERDRVGARDRARATVRPLAVARRLRELVVGVVGVFAVGRLALALPAITVLAVLGGRRGRRGRARSPASACEDHGGGQQLPNTKKRERKTEGSPESRSNGMGSHSGARRPHERRKSASGTVASTRSTSSPGSEQGPTCLLRLETKRHLWRKFMSRLAERPWRTRGPPARRAAHAEEITVPKTSLLTSTTSALTAGVPSMLRESNATSRSQSATKPS